MPRLPASAAPALTLRSLPSVAFDFQAEKLPVSKLSEKIWSEEIGGTFGVRVAVAIEELVAVAGTSDVCVPVAAIVGSIAVGVRVIVGVVIEPEVGVRVAVGFGAVPVPTQSALPESVNVCPAIGTNCQS